MTERKAGAAVAARNETSTAVATRPEGLPMEISAGTIRIPKIKKGEPLSDASGINGVGFLDLFTTTGQDDQNPVVIGKADLKTGLTKTGNEVRFHVLAVQEGRSESVNGDLVSYQLMGGRWISPYDDTEAGPNAYVTQTYTVCLPEVDPETPFHLMVYKTSMPAARNINTALVEHLNKGGAPWELAFELSVKKRENKTYKWGIFQARSMEARDEDVAAAAELAGKVAAILPRSAPEPVDRPEI